MLILPHNCSSLSLTKLTSLLKSQTKQRLKLRPLIFSFRNLNEIAPKPPRPTHLERTANQFRQMHFYKAKVHQIKDATDKVRTLTLKVDEPGLTFQAGQWVDFFIPNVEIISGYSMTSAPYLAEKHGILDLAVKYSSYPPTHWIHKECQLGSEVTIRVGGEFFYDPLPNTKAATADLLCIGGGVGINPMVSIANHYSRIMKESNIPNVKPGRMKLFYCAKTCNDLVFRETFEKLESKIPVMSCYFYVTKEDERMKIPPNTFRGRIDRKVIEDTLKGFDYDNLLCYICGPTSMIENMEKILLEIGINKDSIKFEKWL